MMRSHWCAVLTVILSVAVVSPAVAQAKEKEMPGSPFTKRLAVPPFPEGLSWLNTAGPLELGDLKGKYVLIDFWTYCCINCMHILPELKKLEKTYPNNLVVIGVHSAKFEAEQDAKNIDEAIRRHGIEHPVINDADHKIWNRFNVRAWPTVLLIDPEGYAVWGTSGEITFEQVDKQIKASLPYYRKQGLLNETPPKFDVARRKVAATALKFPGKILADAEGGRLFIADSSHNRIVVTGLDGTLREVIGSGQAGRSDGGFTVAQFNQPQGLALKNETLYVADTENHLIRKIDMKAREVTTVAGVGRQSREPEKPGKPSRAALSSPWDLCIEGENLFIAMAGAHQIWRMRLDGALIGPYAGNGREDIVDGPLVSRQPFEPGFASFAQPSGLACDGKWLYVADSEGSSIRAVPLAGTKDVRTVVGTARQASARLFTFGDVDGEAAKVRLQHPLGIAFYDGQLYTADTYNNKLKKIDPANGKTTTVAGTGAAGHDDDPATFNEPGGLSAAAGKLYVADTNSHLIRVVDLETGKVTTLAITGLTP